MFLLKKACAEATPRIPPGRLPGPCHAGSVPPIPLTYRHLGTANAPSQPYFLFVWKGEQKALCDWGAVAEGGFGWGLRAVWAAKGHRAGRGVRSSGLHLNQGIISDVLHPFPGGWELTNEPALNPPHTLMGSNNFSEIPSIGKTLLFVQQGIYLQLVLAL